MMNTCEIPTVQMLPNPVFLKIDDPQIDFEKAKTIAKSKAQTYHEDTMLLSWFDKEKESYSPFSVECCSDGKPSWVSYALSRGGELSIDINDGKYVFIFSGDLKLT